MGALEQFTLKNSQMSRFDHYSIMLQVGMMLRLICSSIQGSLNLLQHVRYICVILGVEMNYL
ncbi:hypothetical protein RchiOBHm_Chr1g0323721 [Rosa chinensis]|uniref:Uncharacterized protein n=1 Tax=Rosa chinensis TaxID=74649 RepID=A0A2P6S9N4_ROSCH|nr:hypothetical protein RchiOBHm_Chr1g0323721 [Rosa chinensis]